MNEFFEVFYRCKGHHWRLEIYYSSIVDFCINITDGFTDEKILSVSDSDHEYAFAKAQIQLKDWLSEHKGGY